MADLLNLPGPFFIAAYVVLWIVAAKLRGPARRLCPATWRDVPTASTPLSTMDAAWLAGGEQRVLDVAVTQLAQRGIVTGGADGKIETGAPLAPGAHDAEAAVYGAVRRSGKPFDSRGARPAGLARIEQALVTRGLVHGTSSSDAGCVRFAANVPMFLLLALGIAKLVIGLQRDRPVGILAVLLVGTVGMMLASKQPGGFRTRAGNAALVDLQRANAALRTTVLRRGSDVAASDQAMAVALFGLAALEGGPLWWLHATLAPPPASSSGGSGSDSGDSGGSSCSSGGSSCGGGGGGCGGCGS